ncbi:C-terminal domain of CinA type S [Vibrio maritimus]|uniref:C-terminal domain of CinA type S n=1 Tax=Vibrio maritimus TaxID=990268 RepID=A0A090SIP4_9VIBR|nr:C-terminal domain of CinA type S [Vibrio maritimus]
MQNISELSANLGQLLQQRDQVLVTAESCTGGGVATAITDIAGSSAWFDRAFVTYSNDAKMEMIGVKSETLGQHGAVSEPVVIEMAQGHYLIQTEPSVSQSVVSLDPVEAVKRSQSEPYVLHGHLLKAGRK